MMPGVMEADPNAEMETWVKRCDRAILERMYILVYQQAQLAMEKAALAQEQVKLERGLPDKYREGVYIIKMVNGQRQPFLISTFDSVLLWNSDPASYGEEIEEFLRSLIE